MKQFVELFSALLAPTVALVGVIIAIQQWRINEIKLRHDLYVRRMEVWNGCISFIRAMCLVGLMPEAFQKGNYLDEQTHAFYDKTKEGYFLFGDDIEHFIQTIDDTSRQIINELSKLSDEEIAEDTKNSIKNTLANHGEWFTAQEQVAKRLFKPYMRLAANTLPT